MFGFVAVVLTGSHFLKVLKGFSKGGTRVVVMHRSVGGVVRVCHGVDLVVACTECINSNRSGVCVGRGRIVLQVHFIPSGCMCVAVFIVKWIGV